MPTGLRERKKVQVREQLIAAANELFDELGYDRVTVDQIAEAAWVSPRTFFRYFGSKEALLFADQQELIDALRAAIAAQPPASSPLDVLRTAVKVLSDRVSMNREHHLRRARLVGSGETAARYERTVLRPQWEQAIAEAIAERLGVDVDVDLRPRLFAGVGLAVMLAVRPLWMASEGHADLDALLDEGFASLAETSSAVRRRR
jgi:AcrR family transcriptional regulator